MHTPGAERNQGLGAAVKDVTEHASSWFRLERELAVLELKKKVTSLGLGLVLAIAAGLVALYAIGFLFATITAGLATAMPVWLALLLVTLLLFATAAILGLVGYNRIQRGTPPVPEQAIQEAKLTTSALKGNGR
jgi:Putative Actinobacterial Holin-X, holin superfamily III